MIRRDGPKPPTKYWFEEDDDDFWYDELDLRFAIPAVAAMALIPLLIFFLPKGWISLVLVICFFVAFLFACRRKAR